MRAVGYTVFSEGAAAMKHFGCKAAGRLRHVQHFAVTFVFRVVMLLTPGFLSRVFFSWL